MAIAFLDNGELKSVGGFQTQGYGVPRPDQSIKPMLIEKDDSSCVTLQIAVLGGEWLGEYAIRKHEKTPEAVLVCGIDQCLDNIGVSSGAGPTTVAQPSPQPSQAPMEKQEGSSEGATTPKEISQPQIVTANEETIKSEGSANGNDVKGNGNGGAPVAARPANEVDSSGIEPANETSIFDSAARAIEALPEGSGSEASAEGELPKAEESHDTEILTTVPNSVAEGGEAPMKRRKLREILMFEDNDLTITSGCSDGHTDLRVCESYFADYLGKVKEWADKHNQILGQQMWKACKLLSQVKHVPTMCCDKFRSTCAAHLQTRR
ncbi:hypothetical protein ANCDUO_22491 [Ancylostoma duodenale]|uniref:Uncharacterized protein n=1 Tax=Ancylostoma duodenale TaxID=51022 RepID=A0A0C2FL17_9BILA|nr:hypothetical protein ANCDUO_22491 [Ancylostoma duodenale]